MVGCVFMFRCTVKQSKCGGGEVVVCHSESVESPTRTSESQFLGCLDYLWPPARRIS